MANSFMDSSNRSKEQKNEKEPNPETEIFIGDISKKDDPNEIVAPTAPRTRSFIGFLFAIASAFSLSITNIFARKAVLYSGAEVVFATNVLILISIGITMLVKKQNLLGPKENRRLLVIRSVLITIAIICMRSSVKLVNPSDSTAIFHTNIIVVAILARCIFREFLSFIHIFSLIIAIFGVFLICQPPFLLSLLSFGSSNNLAMLNSTSNSSVILASSPAATNFDLMTLLGLSLAMVTSVFIAIGTIVLKKLTIQNVDFTCVLIYTAYVGAPVTLIVALIFRKLEIEKAPHGLFDDLWILFLQSVYALLSAAGSIVTQIFWIFAIRYEDPAKVSIVRINEFLMTFFLQIVILNIFPNLFSIFGSLLIFTATLLVVMYKIMHNKYLAAHTEEDRHQQSGFKRCFFYQL